MLIIPFIKIFFYEFDRDVSGVLLLNSLIALSYISYSIGFFVRKRKSLDIFSSLVKKIDVNSPPKAVLNAQISLMALAAATLFVCLTKNSGFGFLPWLLDPRQGYQFHRTGLGHLYVGSLALWNFIFLYILFFKIKKTAHLIVATMAIIIILYFYGSKGMVVFALLESIVYYNYFIRKLKFRWALIICSLFVVVFSLIFSLYSKKKNDTYLPTNILRYSDHYNNSRMFFSDVDKDFEYEYGKEYLSSLWMYIPRAFYPSKPFNYGKVKYITDKYYPGAGASGHTPAFTGPVESFLNFGFPGVIILGFIRGYFSSLFYNFFLKYKNFLGFILLSNLMGYSIFPIIPGIFYKVLWCIFNILSLLFHKQIIGAIVKHRKNVSLWQNHQTSNGSD